MTIYTGFNEPPRLPDIGILGYNGVEFTCLYHSTVSGTPMPDAAGRTNRYVEWTISVEGLIDAADAETDKLRRAANEHNLDQIRIKLEQPGGQLFFEGKGLGPFSVNMPGGTNKPTPLNSSPRDVAWGPKPKLLAFTPLGGSLAALVSWQVVVCLVTDINRTKGPFLQFNESVSIGYDDEDYSILSLRGTMEIPLTRKKADDPTLSETVDTYRQRFLDFVFATANPNLYRITRRSFEVSRDRRSMEWNFEAVELPPMALPMEITHARGTYSVRPSKQAPAIVRWLCSLRATYTVRKDRPRRTAWWAFISLLRWRMSFRSMGTRPIVEKKKVKKRKLPKNPFNNPFAGNPAAAAAAAGVDLWDIVFGSEEEEIVTREKPGKSSGYLIHFGFDEGLYLDSRQTSFEATWVLLSDFDSLLISSGIWQYKLKGVGGAWWAGSVRDIIGPRSWLANNLDPKAEAVVDFNLGGPKE